MTRSVRLFSALTRYANLGSFFGECRSLEVLFSTSKLGFHFGPSTLAPLWTQAKEVWGLGWDGRAQGQSERARCKEGMDGYLLTA